MEKKSYESYNEIHGSYEAIHKTYQVMMEKKEEIAQFFKEETEWIFLACGSSYWMSLSAARMVRFRIKTYAEAVKAGDVITNPQEYQYRFKKPVFVVPSRSGMTGELLDAIKLLKEYYPQAKIFSVTEYEINGVKELSDMNISISWANEKSVCQTRSFNCLWTAFIVIIAICGKQTKLLLDLEKYLKKAPELYKKGELLVRKIIEDMGCPTHVVTLGSGIQYGVVIEGAYIVIEMAEQNANYYQVMEYRHGPIVTAKEGTLVNICSGGNRTRSLEKKMAEEIRKYGAKTVSVTCRKDMDSDDYNISLEEEYEPEIAALYFIFVQQSLAYHIAIYQKKDPDNPGELVRYIVYQ